MAYLGKTPSQAVRQRYIFTASAGDTSISGADDNGNTLTYTDGAYADVYLNGVLLVAGTDYNTSTANTIGGLSALSEDDVVEIVVYDTFAVFGGEVQGDLEVTNGTLTAGQGITVDNDGATVATFDRATSDGTIIDLQKDGSTVGTIGTFSGDVFIHGARSNSGIRFRNEIRPASSDGSNADGTVDLGDSQARFKDLYLSGGAYIGGTGSANYLDDYEEGTWTPVLNFGTGISYTSQSGKYVKIGEVVYATYDIQVSASSNDSSTVHIGGLPFNGTNLEGVGGNIDPNQSTFLDLSTNGSAVLGHTNGNNVRIYKATGATLIYTDCNSSGTIRGSVVYRVA